MSQINYDLLGGGTGGDPPEGIYEAYLCVAKIVETSKGDALVTEWQVNNPGPYYWTAWHGFEANRINITQDYLDGLGVDRAAAFRGDTQEQRDEAFGAALEACQGHHYQVRITTWSGGVNTFIDHEVVIGVPVSDIPADTADLPEPAAVGAVAAIPDDDVPF